MTIKTDEVKVDEARYPRIGISLEVVERYRLILDKLPLIAINKNKILIDGRHRLEAHKREGRKSIEAEVVDIPDEQILVEAIKRNRHGLPLCEADRVDLARRLYKQGMTEAKIADTLDVTQPAVSGWVKWVKIEMGQERDNKIMTMYKESDKTQDEIAEILGISQATVSETIRKQNEKPPVKDDLYVKNVVGEVRINLSVFKVMFELFSMCRLKEHLNWLELDFGEDGVQICQLTDDGTCAVIGFWGRGWFEEYTPLGRVKLPTDEILWYLRSVKPGIAGLKFSKDEILFYKQIEEGGTFRTSLSGRVCPINKFNVEIEMTKYGLLPKTFYDKIKRAFKIKPNNMGGGREHREDFIRLRWDKNDLYYNDIRKLSNVDEKTGNVMVDKKLFENLSSEGGNYVALNGDRFKQLLSQFGYGTPVWVLITDEAIALCQTSKEEKGVLAPKKYTVTYMISTRADY
jgi:predicted transcriptional regulator